MNTQQQIESNNKKISSKQQPSHKIIQVAAETAVAAKEVSDEEKEKQRQPKTVEAKIFKMTYRGKNTLAIK